MKSLRWFPALLLVVAAPLGAQSSVWKVTHDGHTLYLGGTCHMLRPSDFPLPAEFDDAYAEAQHLVFETDLARMQAPETQQLMLARGMFGSDEGSLKDALSPEAWAAVEQYCAGGSLPLGIANRFRPWLFAVTVAIVELQKLGVTLEGVDVHYFQRAQADQKTVAGLEVFEKHLEFVFNLGAGQENEMILHSVKEAAEIPTMFAGVVAAWRAGDLAKLDEFLAAEMRRDYPNVFHELIVKRNEAWLPQLNAMLQTGPVEFVLVGAGHLSGAEGLVAALKARGCTVEQIVARKTSAVGTAAQP